MFSSETCKIFNNTLESTDSSVKHLRDDFFNKSNVYPLLILFLKESMKVNKSIKSQPVRNMCHIDDACV